LTEDIKTNENIKKKRNYYRGRKTNGKQNNKNENTKLETKPMEVIKQNIEVENEPKKDAEVKRKNIRRNYVRKNVKAEIKKNDENAVVSTPKPVHEKKNIKVARDRLKIIPLGGLEEVGKNMTVFEYGNEMIIVDCGVAFPEDDMLGVDLVIPDFSYLTKNREKFKAMVITHGHEDHIGAIPYVLKELNVPVYGTRLTLGLIKNKLEEHKLVRSTSLKCVKAGDVITIGCFKIEFIRSTHSIADSVALAITTPVGVIFHTGDFKIDYTPIDGKPIDLSRIAEIGNQGVLALMSDSTNAEREGYTMSEKTVGKVFDNIFTGCTKRIIVATFASNVHRVQQIVNSAVKTNRKVAICGRSMENVMNVAIELGYLNIPDGVLIDIDDIDDYIPERLVLITTGSQGETMSGLSRMASGTHRKVVITRDDLVIISATPIPGNEKLVSNVIDDLFKIGADVIYHSLADVHVSGHACQEEQKLMLSLVKPKYFIPVHGEYRHLKAHAETAMKIGIPEENIMMLTNGRVLELDKNMCKLGSTVPAGQLLVDGLGVGDVGNIVLKDRQHLSQDGLIIVVIAMDGKTGQILAGPDIISRGFVYVRESEDLMDSIKRQICKDISNMESEGIKDWTTIKTRVKDTLHDFVYSKTKRNPMIIPIISEI
jgi:ribonuclease J